METSIFTVGIILIGLSGWASACTTAQESPSPSPEPTVQASFLLTDTLTPFPPSTATPTPLTSALPPAPTATEPVDLSTLPVSFPILSAEIATYFNQIARPDDSALIPVARIDLLPKVTAGKIRVAYPSWEQAAQALPSIHDSIDIIAYNPEHWDQTPAAEQENLVQVVQQARKDADAYGLPLMVAPDRRFDQEYLSQIVPYVDSLGLQGQRLQDDPAEFSDWIGEQIRIARESNPEVRIYVQVGANQGSPEQMVTAIQTVAGEIDGISIWSNPATLDTLKAFIALIRPEG